MNKTFLIVFDEDYVTLSSGSDAVAAVCSHYDEMEAYCSSEAVWDMPAEAMTLVLYEIPEDQTEEVNDIVADMDSEVRWEALSPYCLPERVRRVEGVFARGQFTGKCV